MGLYKIISLISTSSKVTNKWVFLSSTVLSLVLVTALSTFCRNTKCWVLNIWVLKICRHSDQTTLQKSWQKVFFNLATYLLLGQEEYRKYINISLLWIGRYRGLSWLPSFIAAHVRKERLFQEWLVHIPFRNICHQLANGSSKASSHTGIIRPDKNLCHH